jgi:hypothetical protein
MKRHTFLFIIFLTFVFINISCDVKEKLGRNTFLVIIEPSEIEYMQNGASQTFSAIVRTVTGEVLDVNVHWNFSNSNLGSLSVSDGKTTVFKADAVNKGIGILSAEYEGVKRSINIQVSDDILLYDNDKFSSLVKDLCWYGGGTADSGTVTISTIYDNGQCLDFYISLRRISEYAGFYIQFNQNVDLSAYNHLKFAGRVIKIDVSGKDYIPIHVSVFGVDQSPIDMRNFSWQDYDVSLAGVGSSNTENVPFNMSFLGTDWIVGNMEIRLNNIRFEK